LKKSKKSEKITVMANMAKKRRKKKFFCQSATQPKPHLKKSQITTDSHSYFPYFSFLKVFVS